ncbi:MAG: PAS domain S-box protein [Alphaproteobacteria bacterium]|nr:PAS domain S-box protein [Alphaproteobacteria bacterium]
MIWDSDLLTSGLHFLIVAAILYAATRLFLNRDRLTSSVRGYGFGLFFGALAGVGLLHLLTLLAMLIVPVLQSSFVSAGGLESFISSHHETIVLLSTGIIAVGVAVASWSVRTLIVAVDDRDRLFRAVFDNVPISMNLKDRDGRFLLVNKPQEVWLGRSSAEIIGKTTEEVLDDAPLVNTLAEAEETVLNTGMVKNVEIRVQNPDGRNFHHIVTKFPIRSPDGSIESAGTFAVDVTERRQAELALERSEARFRDFAESSADWFWEMDETLRFTYMSPNVEQVVGVPPEWHYGKTREDLLGPDYDRDSWDDHLQTLRAHSPFRDFVYRREGFGVEPKWLRVSGKPISDENGVFLGYRGTASDVTAFMEARARVERAENLLRDAIEGLDDSVILYDADERYILSNDKYVDFYPSAKAALKLGVERETVARAIFESADVRNAGQELEKWKLRRQRPPILDQELNEQQLSDGRWLLAQEHETSNGNTVLVRTDITGLKQREIALRESEERFRALFDNSPVTILIKDTEGRYVTANRRWHDWFNPEGKEIKGKTAFDFYPQDHSDEVSELDRDILQFGSAMEVELNTPFPDGMMRVTLTQKFPIYDHDGNIAAIGSFNTDITERKRAEEAQRRSERRLAEIFDASPAMIIVCDYATGQFLEVNAAALSTLGYRLDEMLGRTSLELGIWKDKRQRDKLVALLDRDKFVRNYEIEYHAKDGTAIPLLFSGAKIESDGDFQILGVMTNIAEWRALEDQLRQSQKMEAVGQLTGGLAHDFNNLLGVIIGNLDFLGEALEEDKDLGGYVKTATKAAVGGAELNKRLLAFSRTQPLAPKVLDLNAHVSGMLAVLRRTLGETITLEAIQNDTLWSCDVDPAQVETALLNLAINARDAMPSGGTLTIETANVRLDDDYAATQAEVTPGAYVRLTVTDTGRGMAPSVVEHVFEPFFTTKAVGEGSGLGLSMIFGFAKQSGGHVTVQSEEGVGTAVTLYLPRSRRPAQLEDETVEIPNPSSGTVLVVEDDPDLRLLAETMLDSLGYKVLAAKDGRSALTAMGRAKHVDLLLTDVVLPGGMNGPAIAEAAVKRQDDIKVLYMSGYTQDAMTQQGQIGNDYQLLQKPFRKAELAQKIEAVLTEPV